MGLIYNAECDLCGEIKPIISAGTVHTTGFCKECLKLVIEDCQEAIEEIEEGGKWLIYL